MRNLLLVHLESLNYTTYQTNKKMFPNLRKWEQKSLVFSNYFSTATSTVMVISDMAYGGMKQNEPCVTLRSILQNYCYESSFPDDLQKKGYQVRVLAYPATKDGDVPKCNERHFVGYDVNMEEMESYETYVKTMDAVMAKEKPFAVWACNYISNVNYYVHMQGAHALSGLQRWEDGFAWMDRFAGELLDILERKDLLEDTTVIFYGDHGDDFFGHGKHRGLMHAIEPYASLIHTPFWIYDSRFKPEEADILIDTTDVRLLIGSLLSIREEAGQSLTVHDLKISVRKYSLARNIYAAQRLRESTFHKGYSLTDGKFLFLVSERGMELYRIDMDGACQHNLLDYFDFCGEVLTLHNMSFRRMQFHFLEIMEKGSVSQVEQTFYTCRSELMRKVEELYAYASCGDRGTEIDFNHIHYGWEERERRKAEKPDVMAAVLNRLADCMCTDRLAVYGCVEEELKGLWPSMEKKWIYGLADCAGYELMYLSLEDRDELCNIKSWLDVNSGKISAVIHIKGEKEAERNKKELRGIGHKYCNPSLLAGTLYLSGKIFTYPDSLSVPDSFTVLAIVTFKNDAAYLKRTTEYLLAQETDVFLLDDGSDDGSHEIAQYYSERYSGHVFLKRIMTGEAGYDPVGYAEKTAWEMDYDWYMYLDAREMRCGPWEHKNLRETLFYIDQLGFNAVENIVTDFEVISDEESRRAEGKGYFDFRHKEKEYFHRRTWKKDEQAGLKRTDGHIVRIKNPRIFPLTMLSRYEQYADEEKATCYGWLPWDETAHERYFISLFMGCAIPLDTKEEFETYEKYLVGKRVILYGAGNYGKYAYEKLAGLADIIAWADRESRYLPRICGREIKAVREAVQMVYDAVLVAISDGRIRQEVIRELTGMGVPEEKIY